LIESLIRAAFEEGIALIVTDAFRSVAEQDRIYAQGRTTPGAIVTQARGGSSWHNYGLAADVAVLAGGKPTWPNDANLWARIGAIGKRLGLQWGGDFSSGPDLPHFELHTPGIGPGISAPVA
jgi:peptidoglycan L-alanyl-D-glutamate endopeptidase CwlK